MDETFGRRFDRVALCFGPAAGALLSLWLGLSPNWDLRNYHWYNAYALLHGRLGFDVAVAHHATYYNPLLDLPVWGLAQIAPGWLVAVALGALHGGNFSLLYLIGRDSFELPQRRITAVALALCGVTGAFALALHGTTFYDNLLSLPVLFALWRLLQAEVDTRGIALVGLIAGVTVGLKLPVAPFGIGLCAAVVLRAARWRQRWRWLLWFGATAALGFLTSAGWWCWRLGQEFGNPLFPYFNQWLGSELILDASYRDTRFLPQSAFDALLFPLRFALDWQVAADGPISDWRIAIAYLLVCASLPLGWLGRCNDRPFVTAWRLRVLLGFAGAAYLSWLAVFAIYRYITTLELLAPLLAVALIGQWPGSLRRRGLVAAGVLLAMLMTTRVDFGDRRPFGADFVEVTPPKIARPEASLALMTGVEPMAFAIPAFPPETAFLRVDGWLVGPDRDTPLLRGMRARIERHLADAGDLYTIFAEAERERGDRALDLLGLRRSEQCAFVRSNLALPLRWCAVEAQSPPRPPERTDAS